MTDLVTLDEVERAAQEALTNCGGSDLQAAAVARSIRAAEAERTCGIGLGYLPFYFRRLKVGKIAGHALAVVTRPAPGLVRVDVDVAGGCARTAFEAGRGALVDTAKPQGIEAMVTAHAYAYACEVLDDFTGALACDGLMAIMSANASATMAFSGDKAPVFGKNPWSFAASRAGDPLVIDSSSSAIAFLNLPNAAVAGEAIPATWALDKEGCPTTDAAAGMAGSIALAGGQKGAALALMVEVLAAGLTGASWSCEAPWLGDDEGGPPRPGQTVIAIRADGFGKDDRAGRIDALLAAMTVEEGTRGPGDRRHQNRNRITRNRGAVNADLLATLGDLGASV